MPISDIVEHYFGVPVETDTPETDVAVGASVVQAVFTNARRLVLELSNTGATDITIRRDPAVTAPNGFLIPTKSNYIMKVREYADDVGRPLWAIGSGAGGTLHVREVVIVG